MSRPGIGSEELVRWTVEARQRSLELVADLDDGQLVGPHLDVINPLLWEIGHAAWFQELWVLRDHLGRDPIRDDADELWDSIEIPHDDRWDLPLPDRDETVDYMRRVRDRVVEVLRERGEGDGELRYRARYAVHHEDMHTEAYTYTRQTLSYPPPALSFVPEDAGAAPGGGPLDGDVEVPGGTFRLGAGRDDGFVFDNEKWAHEVELQPFRISRAPVTEGEFAAFVDAGGYDRRELWSDEGWAWRREADADAPAYWRRRGGEWHVRRFDRHRPLRPHRPMIHVNWHEARAWCRWAGRRLPTEAEWEAAAAAEPDGSGGLSAEKRSYPWGEQPPGPRRVNMDWRRMGTVEVGALPESDSAFGCRQMLGNSWEWTADTFGPYPGFERDMYEEYSEPWFGTRKVLRGGAWASRSRMLRNTLRSYYTPDRRDVWAGFRTCEAAGARGDGTE